VVLKKRDNFTFTYVGPCHYGMARPRISDRLDGLQTRRVAGNIFNKQSRTADNGQSRGGLAKN
jgi:hypothetical protein